MSKEDTHCGCETWPWCIHEADVEPSPTQSDKTVEEILDTIEVSDVGVYECSGGHKLDDYTKQQAIAALTAREERMVQPVVEAFTNKGSHPEYHDQQMRRLETEWSSLYFAVRQLTHITRNDELKATLTNQPNRGEQ